MILHVIRAIFVLAVLAIAITYATQPDVLKPKSEPGTQRHVGMSPETKVTLAVVVPVILAVLVILVDMGYRRKNLTSISGLFLGLVAGIVLAYVLGKVVDLVSWLAAPGQMESAAEAGTEPPLVAMVKLLVGAFAIYLSVSFVLQTKDDFRFIIPYVEFAKQTRGARPMVLDTSVIIDGRIADIAETSMIESPLIVPRFILEEIQEVADASDKLKRNRGRRGLDMLNRLQTSDKVEVRLMDARIAEVEAVGEVDHKLVALAEHLDGRIVTNDYNLNKIAQLRGVGVININDLANALKPVVLPGETITVKIIKPGEELGQGVGYLDDGTMIVAEQGRDYIGREMTITVTSVLQTSAGRMIFGRPDGKGSGGPSRGRRT